MKDLVFITRDTDLQQSSVGQPCEKYADMSSFIFLWFLTQIFGLLVK